MSKFHTRSQGSSNLLPFEQELGHLERQKKKEKALGIESEVEMADNENNPHFQDNPLFLEQPDLPQGNIDQNPPAVGGNAGNAGNGNQPQVAAAGQQGANEPPRLTLAHYDTPEAFYANRAGIRLPPIARRDFEIKTGLINLVKQDQFHGLPSENPMHHLERFETICNTIRYNGVPEDALKCRLFTFSLADKAIRWYNSLEPDSLRTWEETKAAFLGNFFTKSRSMYLRNKIAGFQQMGTESFHEAWERFKEYTVDCPHHGYTDVSLLNLFYNGIDEKHQNALDIASNGDFMTKTIEEAYTLVNNMAASQANRRSEYDRSRGGASLDPKKIDELIQARLDGLLKKDQRAVNFVAEKPEVFKYQDYDDDDCQADVNYIGGQGNFGNRGFDQNYRNHPNLSYRSNNVENPQDQVYPPMGNQQNQFQNKPFVQSTSVFHNKNQFQNSGFQPKQQSGNFRGNNQSGFQNQNQGTASSSSQDNELKQMMQQLLQNQTKTASDIHQKIDNMYGDLNGKYETLSTHVKMLEKQVAQTSLANKAPSGTLLGKSEANPKEFYNAITLISGKSVGDSQQGQID